MKEAEVEKEKAREGEGPEGANKHLKSNKRQVKKLEDDAAPKHKKAQAAAAEPSKDRKKSRRTALRRLPLSDSLM